VRANHRLRRAAKATILPPTAALLCLLAAAPSAWASASSPTDPLGSGATKLTFAKPFLSVLKKNGVKLSAAKPATVGASLSLPVVGGELEASAPRAAIEMEGSLKFSTAAKAVAFTDFALDSAKHSPLLAKVGGGQLKVAAASGLTTKLEGFGVGVKVKALSLSAKVAERLNKRLHLGTALRAGQLLGSITSVAQPSSVAIKATGRATFYPSSEILAKLKSLFVDLNPVSPVELLAGPYFTLPIIGGTIAPNASSGTLQSGGEIELLQQGGGQIFLHELWAEIGTGVGSVEVNAQPSPPYPGKQPRGPLATLSLAAAATSSNPAAETVTVTGATLALSTQGAALFNEVFAERKAVFATGDPLGTLTFTAQGQ
jgi:hypothetical protein